jgi:hypothetical protein
MNERINEAFVYCWTDNITNMLYVGYHKGAVDDGYVSSSKYFNLAYNKNPASFTRSIIASGNYSDIRVLETKILKSLNAARDKQFYNRRNGNDGGDFYCKGHIPETIEKMRRPKSLDHKNKLRGKRPHVNQKGSANNGWEGFYITPWGKFESINEAWINCVDKEIISKDQIWAYCKPKKNKQIIQKISRSKYLRKEWVGKTYKDLGFDFESKLL